MATKPNQPTPPAAPGLAGLLNCGHCHLPMLATNTDGKPNTARYVCPTTIDGTPSNCPTPPVPATQLDRTILKRIIEHLNADHITPHLIAVVKEQASECLSQAKTELQRQQKSLAHLSPKRERLLQQVEEEEFIYQEVSHLAEASATAAGYLTTQVADTKRRVAAHERATTDDEWITERAKDTDALIRSSNSSAQTQLFHALIKEITLDHEKIRVSYKTPIFVDRNRIPGNTEAITLQKGLAH